MNLSEVIQELVRERGLDKAVLDSIIVEGMLAAYERKYPGLELKGEQDPQTGQVNVFVKKTVVSHVEDEDVEVSLKKARHINKEAQLDDEIWVPFDGTIGRIEILRARQVIASKIRAVEARAVYDEFKSKEGSIVYGVIHKCERGGAVVKIDDTLAFLPRSLTSSTDKCMVGYSIRALLKEVLPEPRNDNQLILDRSSEEFLLRLLEIEIPEVFEKLVEIKAIARKAGYKTKIVVSSNDSNIDPVGTCVGVGGSRIKPILKEIGGEKVDVISWSEAPEVMVRNALKPAVVDRVEIDGDIARVWLDEDQRSLAIGKMGQNIALASRLSGYNIQLMQDDSTPSTIDMQDIDIDVE